MNYFLFRFAIFVDYFYFLGFKPEQHIGRNWKDLGLDLGVVAKNPDVSLRYLLPCSGIF